MVYVVDETGKVFKFCSADGWSQEPGRRWCTITRNGHKVGGVWGAVYAGHCHPNQVTQANDSISYKSIEQVLRIASETINMKPQGWRHGDHLREIKRALRDFNMTTCSWQT